MEGCIEVYRNVKGGKAQLLASLFPGALLGTGSLLLKERHNTSCVANKSTDVWVYEMNSLLIGYRDLLDVGGNQLSRWYFS